jgi:TRAP transporter 4TM/12TM fusion protein
MGIFTRITQSFREEGIKEGMDTTRKLTGWWRMLVKIVAAGFSLFYLYTTYFGYISQESHVGVYILGTFTLVLVLYKARKKSPESRISLLDGILVLMVFVIIFYFIWEFRSLADNFGEEASFPTVFLGCCIILISLEVARRSGGNAIPIIGIVLLIYAYFGPYFPLGLGHAGFSVSRIAENLFLGADGILGMICNIFATYIIIFVVLGSFMEASGSGKVFVDLAYAITGKCTGGPGLASVITSALFGTVSGSAVANVVVDGVFTIPLMKRNGYPAYFAGAVEAATSTGGQYMPPIMGAGAFLMAEMTGTPYVQVIKIAATPALLYFASVGVIIYFEAVKRGLKGMPASELPKFKEVFKQIHLLMPIPILIALLVLDMSPFIAAFYTIGASVLLSWIRKDTRMGIAKIVGALENGARASLAVGGTVGVIGIVIGITNLSGLANYFQQFITSLAFGNLFLLIFWLLVAGTFIGMGMPTTAAYVVMVILGVPALIKMGVAPLTAHLMVFWISVLSSVTPPVAIAAWAGAAIARSDPWKTGYTATKLASWIYLMPFLFAYTSILKVGWNFNFFVTVFDCIIALIAWGTAMEGHLFRRTSLIERILLFIAAFSLLHESHVTDFFGVGLFALVVIIQRISIARERKWEMPVA